MGDNVERGASLLRQMSPSHTPNLTLCGSLVARRVVNLVGLHGTQVEGLQAFQTVLTPSLYLPSEPQYLQFKFKNIKN
eukprot:1307029-Amphidinium_carterae.1